MQPPGRESHSNSGPPKDTPAHVLVGDHNKGLQLPLLGVYKT